LTSGGPKDFELFSARIENDDMGDGRTESKTSTKRSPKTESDKERYAR